MSGLRFSEEHEWVSVDGDIATVGISDFAQQQLGDVVFVASQGTNRIDVFDVAGRRVPGTIEAALPAGAKTLTWSADGLAAGVYHARLRAAGQSRVVRFVRVR